MFGVAGKALPSLLGGERGLNRELQKFLAKGAENRKELQKQ